MKTDTHPQYFPEATVTCNGCNRTYTVGSTVESVTVELCSNCHPFYTGKQKLVDTAGRVDRYQARAAKQAETAKAAKVKTKAAPKVEPKSDATSADATPTPEERLAKMKAELADDSKQ